MTDTETKASAGFSTRFNELLNRAGVPEKGRHSIGAARFDVTRMTFALWCTADQTPRTYQNLIDVIRDLLTDIPGEYDPHAVAFWLQAGDSAPNPFEEIAVDNILKGDIYILLDAAMRKRGIELSAKQINKISLQVYNYVCDQRKRGQSAESIRNNNEVKRLINSYMELEQAGIR